MLRSSQSRMLIFNTAMILPKTTRDSIGVQVMTLRGKAVLADAAIVTDEQLATYAKYVAKNIPVTGGMAKDMEVIGQMTL